jgi:RND family efflux transporter MFP subunit
MKIVRFFVTTTLLAAVAGGGYYAYRNLLPAQAVTTSVARVAPVSEAVYGTGTVEPQRWAKVVPLARRRLVELCQCEGQAVKTGQVLARQDDAEERSELRELEITNAQLQRDLDRAEKDRDKSSQAQAEYEQRWTKFEQSKSRIAAQKVKLDSMVLRAPLDGMVLRRDGEVGEIAGPTDVLFWVGPPAPTQVVAEVNEEEINRLAVGQKAFLRSDAFAAQVLRATVAQITPKGDPSRKTFRVYLALPADTPLRIGMSVEVNIIFRDRPSATVVPSEAVVDNAVQVINDGRIEKVAVTTGIRGGRNVEIVRGISKGMAVLSPARPDLADGTRVRIDNSSVKAIADAPAVSDAAPDQDTPASPEARATDKAPVAVATADPDTSAISSAITAHFDSVVNDARRNVDKLTAAR